jgi:hypothetical protein
VRRFARLRNCVLEYYEDDVRPSPRRTCAAALRISIAQLGCLQKMIVMFGIMGLRYANVHNLEFGAGDCCLEIGARTRAAHIPRTCAHCTPLSPHG